MSKRSMLRSFARESLVGDLTDGGAATTTAPSSIEGMDGGGVSGSRIARREGLSSRASRGGGGGGGRHSLRVGVDGHVGVNGGVGVEVGLG